MTTRARTPIADTQSLAKFDELIAERGQFWSDLFQIQKATGLRNIDVRNLTWDSINWDTMQLTIVESKQSTAKLTKAVNKRLAALWLDELEIIVQDAAEAEGKQRYIYQSDIAETETQFLKIAKRLGIESEIADQKESFYSDNEPSIKEEIIRSGVAKHQARVIDLSRNKKAVAILNSRKGKYGKRSDLVFSVLTLQSNRASEDKPVTRQACYKVMQEIQGKLEAWRISLSQRTGAVFQAIRLGCHTMRKSAATALYKATKDIALVSKWIGHSDPSTTVRYIG
jgi:integrase